ncbi:MAG: putative replication initiation protein [Cressdnaviricota sp.]|nr:MAG: putative replication initiation protein [Cressdnaviricota sp.]
MYSQTQAAAIAAANQFEIYSIMRRHGWSSEATNDMIYKMEELADRRANIEKKLQHQRVFGDVLTVMITVSFDNKMEETPENTVADMKKFIRLFKESNYKWCENACYTFEFFSAEGWNPHLHLVCDKNDAPSTIAKAIRRSPAYKQTGSYRVDVKAGTDGTQIKYIQGDKKESKEENVKKDIKFRETQKLKSYYIL